jgi:hypothetical protein
MFYCSNFIVKGSNPALADGFPGLQFKKHLLSNKAPTTVSCRQPSPFGKGGRGDFFLEPTPIAMVKGSNPALADGFPGLFFIQLFNYSNVLLFKYHHSHTPPV